MKISNWSSGGYLRVPRGGGSFLKKCIFVINSRVGNQIWPPFVPTRFWSKMHFLKIMTPRGVLGGSGGAEPPGKTGAGAGAKKMSGACFQRPFS